MVPFLLARVGPERAALINAECGGDALSAISAGIRNSALTWCGVDDEGVVTLGGVMPMAETGAGYVWQYVADVARNKRGYLEQGYAMTETGQRPVRQTRNRD